jgi:photosystem II CP43 chlorophyll apoprotein
LFGTHGWQGMAAVDNLEDVVGGHIWVGLLCIGGGLFHLFSKPFGWAKQVLIFSGEAYLSYSIGAVAYMGFLAAYFVLVNDTVYPEVFYGPAGALEATAGATTAKVSARGWLATFHFVLAVLFLSGHIWHAIRARGAAAGFDFKQGDTVITSANLQEGNLQTPVSSSDVTLSFLKNLPLYRPGLSPFSRGLEIGMAHGYWLVGPFAVLGPLRDSASANFAGLISASALILILSICLSIYGSVSFEKRLETVPRPAFTKTVPNVPETVRTAEGWSQFSGSFLIGGIGGAIFAYFLLNNLDLFRQVAQALPN